MGICIEFTSVDVLYCGSNGIYNRNCEIYHFMDIQATLATLPMRILNYFSGITRISLELRILIIFYTECRNQTLWSVQTGEPVYRKPATQVNLILLPSKWPKF